MTCAGRVINNREYRYEAVQILHSAKSSRSNRLLVASVSMLGALLVVAVFMGAAQTAPAPSEVTALWMCIVYYVRIVCIRAGRYVYTDIYVYQITRTCLHPTHTLVARAHIHIRIYTRTQVSEAVKSLVTTSKLLSGTIYLESTVDLFWWPWCHTHFVYIHTCTHSIKYIHTNMKSN